MNPPSPAATDLAHLRDLITRLRAPDGCPWDQKQTLGDVRAYLLEEAHEAAAAITAGDWAALAGELGDLLFQVTFIARLGEEQGRLDLGEVIAGIHSKMVARHPHVFGGEPLADAAAVAKAWEKRKLSEQGAHPSPLDGVPDSLPALVGAYRISQKAAGVGFDWPDAESVFAKLDEEIAEVREALTLGPERTREEIGDLLFTAANLARKAGVDPEAALAEANLKFRRRFAAMAERLAAEGRALTDADLTELDQLWNEVK